MTKQHRAYQAYMLRLWQVTSGLALVWRASLEDPHTGERKGFADLESLCAFLKAQAEIGVDSAPLDGSRADDG